MLFNADVFILFATVTFVSCSPFKQNVEDQCGYDNCPALNLNGINVHLIPHSHDDVGWLKTLNEYFNGVSAVIGVEYVISSVLQSLKRNPDRKYTQVETAFFWKWWQHQSETTRNDFRKLVENGQIEIANGGFVMNDEACVNYRSTIHQYTRGLRILNDTLGPCGAPRVGWQIDPFGHSREQALIFKQLGFDGAFFSRLDFRDRLQRMSNKSLNFLWKSSPNIDNSEIFYTILMNHYGAPSGFCYDLMCYDDAINDDPDSFDYNADTKNIEFEDILVEYAIYSTTSNILIPMGGDFNYEAAEQWFINMDRLIKTFKNDIVINVFYSTPSCYIRAVNKMSPTLLTKTDDFFPYTSEEYAYWTGYYTSRPNAKRFERTSFNILQASQQLRAISKMSLNFDITDTDPDLTQLQDSVAVMQHHDAITGTEKQKVANEYNNQMLRGIVKSEESIGTIIGSLLSKSNAEFGNLKLTSCLLANVSICENSNENRFVVAVFNPLSKTVSSHVRLPVTQTQFSITGPTGAVSYDVIQAISDFSYISMNDIKPSANEIVFSASNIPPLGINLYYISADSSIKQTGSQPPKSNSNSDISFGTDTLNFVLDSSTYRIKTITMNNMTLGITQDFYYYPSENGQHETFASGAYLFRPQKGTKTATKVSDSPGILEYSIKGNEVEEAHVRINDWIKQIIRVYKHADIPYIEFDWLVGPIEVDEKGYVGKEIITRFEVTDFNNKGIFYTDSNGRELIKRTRNGRVDYNYDSTIEPITSNYYPVTSRIVMRDENKKLEVALLNDRSQGGSSLNDGQLELMIHRRLLVDDYKGVAEALNEQEFNQGMVTRGKHFLMFGSTENPVNGASIARQERDLELRQSLAAYTLVASAVDDSLSIDEVSKSLNFQYKFLAASLPENVNILTLQKWNDDNTYLLRLEHLYEKNEDPELSQAATIALDELFLKQNIVEIKETTLGANQWLEDYKRKEQLKWNGINAKLSVAENQDDLTKITLNSMEIRTFIIKLQNK